MEQISGFIERITFHNPENGFTVAKLKEPRKRELTTIVGNFPGLQPGETIRCVGDWKVSASHGMQFEVKEYHIESPADLVGIQKYLESGLIQGIGPVYAKRIVEKFGLQTLKIIDESPTQLQEVEGIGEKRVQKIKGCWSQQKSIRNVMIFLQQYGVSPVFAQKIFKVYGDKAIELVQKNPFHLAKDVLGIGFKTADKVASKMGLPPDSPGRVDAAIEYHLTELADEGHVCYPKESLVQLIHEILDLSADIIEKRLQALIETRTLIKSHLAKENEEYIWLRMYYFCEQGIAGEVRRLNSFPSKLRKVHAENALQWVQKELAIQLAANQATAVATAMSEKVLIITGGPGTGKSTITKAILGITKKLTSKIVLAAPTGRAAKRMSEITGWQAKTIHSLLEWSFAEGGFKRNRETPLEADLIIVDESSMIDTILMYQLLKAIPDHARVIFVGDVNQLPSVGAGNVLKDLILSKQIPVAELTEIFRQAKGSKIITNAHLINQGIFPDLSGGFKSDFFFLKAEEPEDVLKTILNLIKERIPKRYRFHSTNDIQILSPLKKGPIGCDRLNLSLQEALNPSDSPLFQYGKRFHLGDKVMQMRNNYKKEVFNGDIGRIQRIMHDEQKMLVNFDGHFVEYQFSELDELVLAYAVSVHKYQGSEAPCIIMPIHPAHYILLNRNLLYTAVTRGKRLVILVGTGRALHIAVANDEVKKRFTGLQHTLQCPVDNWSPSE